MSEVNFNHTGLTREGRLKPIDTGKFVSEIAPTTCLIFRGLFPLPANDPMIPKLGTCLPFIEGHGAIISKEGMVLTADHVIQRILEKQPWVGVRLFLMGRFLNFRASSVRSNSVFDLHCLKIEECFDDPNFNMEFPYVGFGTADEITREKTVYQIHALDGLNFRCSHGQVALPRTRPWDCDLTIVANMFAFEGYSGGALLNTKGQVLGICRAGDDGSNFYVHLSTITNFLNEASSSGGV